MKSLVLYVEDEPDDVFLMERSFKKTAPDVDLRILTDGQQAVDYFDSSKNLATSEGLLSLVILDLNLPGRTGLEVLRQIRNKSTMPKVPVILFSASHQQNDIDLAYAEGCNSYVVKPGDPERLKSLVSLIKGYWLTENRCAKIG